MPNNVEQTPWNFLNNEDDKPQRLFCLGETAKKDDASNTERIALLPDDIQLIEDSLAFVQNHGRSLYKDQIPKHAAYYQPLVRTENDRLQPRLRRPRLLAGTKRKHLHAYKRIDERDYMYDQEYLYLHRSTKDLALFQRCINQAVLLFSDGFNVIEVGGTTRRLLHKKELLGEESVVQHVYLHTESLLEKRGNGGKTYEKLAHDTLSHIRDHALNHDKKIQNPDANFEDVQEQIIQSIIRFLKQRNLTFEVIKRGKHTIISVDSVDAGVLYAPPTIDAIILPRTQGNPVKQSVSLYPATTIHDFQIHISRFTPKANPFMKEMIAIRTGVYDSGGKLLDTNMVQYISHTPEGDAHLFDNRAGVFVNARQRTEALLNESCYFVDNEQPYEDSIDHETFPTNDVNRAYCILHRMLSNLMSESEFVEGKKSEDAQEFILKTLKKHQNDYQFLIDIIKKGKTQVKRYKIVESLAQIFKLLSYYPVAFAFVFDYLHLEQIYPHAHDVMKQIYLHGNLQDLDEKLTDIDIQARVKTPYIFTPDGQSYELPIPTALDLIANMKKQRKTSVENMSSAGVIALMFSLK